MIIAGVYSFKGGKEIIESQFGSELQEVREAIAAVDSRAHLTKVSKEKTMPGKKLYEPGSLNEAFRREFEARQMTIFHKMGIIDVGIEIVPMKAFVEQMSTGVSYFEQFVWDLEHRGVADIDIPVLIFGIDA